MTIRDNPNSSWGMGAQASSNERIGTRRSTNAVRPPAQLVSGSPYLWWVCDDCKEGVDKAMACCGVARCLPCDEKHGKELDLHHG